VLVRIKNGAVVDMFSTSMERGWDLMWLVTGCFAPSTNLLKEVTMFLRSSPLEMVASDCIGRLQKILRSVSFTCDVEQSLVVF